MDLNKIKISIFYRFKWILYILIAIDLFLFFYLPINFAHNDPFIIFVSPIILFVLFILLSLTPKLKKNFLQK